MGFWKHTYHSVRDYGWPHGAVAPGEVIEAKQPPEPAFFEQVDGPASVEAEPVAEVEAPVEQPAVVEQVVTDTAAADTGEVPAAATPDEAAATDVAQ